MSLQPLCQAFAAFAKKKLEIREKALDGCFSENVQEGRFVLSDPLSAELFGAQALEGLQSQVVFQSKDILSPVAFRTGAKRKEGGERNQRSAKRRRSRDCSPWFEIGKGTPKV